MDAGLRSVVSDRERRGGSRCGVVAEFVSWEAHVPCEKRRDA